MYAPLFGLKQEPFSIAPDPRFLYMSERHREALAHLLYGVQGGGGFVLLSGAVGAGKTTVCRCFLEQLPTGCQVAYIFNPRLTVGELLKTVCDEFGIAAPAAAAGTVKDFVDPLNDFLLASHAAGRSCVLIIDEAQILGSDLLEQLRLLTNLETDTRKLLQIILIGQPELRDRLAQPGLEQLAQRVIARYHLQALSEAETANYVRHRLQVAGLTGALPFDAAALRRIHQHARGVPRRINLLCQRALLGAYAEGRTAVGREMIDQAAHEVFDDAPAGGQSRRRNAIVGGAALLLVLAAAVVPWLIRPAPAPVLQAALPASAPAAASEPASAAVAPALLDAAALGIRVAAVAADEDTAWRALAALWSADAGPADACIGLAARGLACYRGRTTLAEIRQLGRPGWLSLDLGGGVPARVLLTGLGDGQATLRLADAPATVSLATLAAVWQGDFATLWRQPPGYTGPGRVDDGSPLAAWLQERLAAYQGAALPAQASLPDRVAAFQRAQGLEADGRVGPLTLMQLNRAAAVAEPRLAALER